MSDFFKLTGPLWAIGPAVVEGIKEESVKRMADEGERQWLAYLGDRLEEPTGYYESNIHQDYVGRDNISINDANVIYGSWLEGVGSRNSPRPGFPGYFAKRDTEDYLRAHGDSIIHDGVGRLIGKLK